MENKNIMLFSMLFKLIQYINTWKKLAIFLVLALSCLVMYVLYDNSQKISYWGWALFGQPQINRSVINKYTTTLLNDTDADVAMVFTVNLSANRQKIIYTTGNDYLMAGLMGKSDLALRTHNPQSEHLIQIINNGTDCYWLTANNATSQYLMNHHIHYLCSAKIPVDNDFFIGLIVLGFQQSPGNQDYIKQQLITAAKRITQ